MVALLHNPDFWLGAALGAVFLVMVVAAGCAAMRIKDKTKATRALAGAVDGRPSRSIPVYAPHKRMSIGGRRNAS